MALVGACAQLSNLSLHTFNAQKRSFNNAENSLFAESVLKLCKAQHRELRIPNGRQRLFQRSVRRPCCLVKKGQVRMLASKSEHIAQESRSKHNVLLQKSSGEGTKQQQLGRRKALELAALVAVVGSGLIGAAPAQAYKPPPEGFRRYTDRLDGFTLLYPEYWVQVRGSGAEVQFRSPQNGDENLFVSVSSPSSSKYVNVKDLGTPQDSSEFIKKQYITEFMSTRLGVRRTAEVLSASSRDVEEGKPYYDIEMAVKSVANTNQLAVTPEERVPFIEWERRYVTVQAVENKRLYELRVQVPADRYERERPLLQLVIDSFRTFPVESFEGGKPV